MKEENLLRDELFCNRPMPFDSVWGDLSSAFADGFRPKSTL